MGAGRSLPAWGKRGRFSYTGSVELGTKIRYGHDSSFIVPADVYAALVAHFAGQRVAVGLSRRPPRHSLGSWLKARVAEEVPVAYVGPILVREGYAERDGEDALRFRAVGEPVS